MDLAPRLLSLAPAALWVLSLLQVLVLAWAVPRLPWAQLRAVPARLHLLGGAFLFLVGLWGIHARLNPLFVAHPLGITAVTLLLGAPLAVWIGTLAQLADLVLRGGGSSLLLVDSLLNVSLPAAVTMACLRLAVRHGPRNLYVYLLGVGFFGAGLSMLAVCLGTLLLIALAGQLRLLQGWSPAVFLLLMFPEGFSNGALVTMFAVCVPDWMKTFDDRHFLPQER